MDPITATTTIITLAAFIKELIEVGHGIAASINKVSENRRQLRDLIKETIQTLQDLESLTRANEKQFHAPMLLDALVDIKSEMLCVLADCQKIMPILPPSGLKKLKHQFKGWLKRDEIEAEIRQLRKHTKKCLMLFTAFSAARNEFATLRIEQQVIVAAVESQVRTRKLMANFILHNAPDRAISDTTSLSTIIAPKPETLFFADEVQHLMQLIKDCGSQGKLVLDETTLSGDVGITLLPYAASMVDAQHIESRILEGILHMKTQAPRSEIITNLLLSLGDPLLQLQLVSESVTWQHFANEMLCKTGISEEKLSWSFAKLSMGYRTQREFDQALLAIDEALKLWNASTRPEPSINWESNLLNLMLQRHWIIRDNKDNCASTLLWESATDAFNFAKSAWDNNYWNLYPQGSIWLEVHQTLQINCFWAFLGYATVLSSDGQSTKAYEVAAQGLEILSGLSDVALTYLRPQVGEAVDLLLHQICVAAENGHLDDTSLETTMHIFNRLATEWPKEFSGPFLNLFSACLFIASTSKPLVPTDLSAHLEPLSDQPAPLPPPTHLIYMDIQEYLVQDVITAFCVFPSHKTREIIHNLVLADPSTVVEALTEQFTSWQHKSDDNDLQVSWATFTLARLIADMTLPKVDQSILAGVLQEIDTVHSCVKKLQYSELEDMFRALWSNGQLLVLEQLFKCWDEEDDNRIAHFIRLVSPVLSHEMGDIALTTALLQNIQISSVVKGLQYIPGCDWRATTWDSASFLFCQRKLEILQYTGRVAEALEFLDCILVDIPVELTVANGWDLNWILFHITSCRLKFEAQLALHQLDHIVNLCSKELLLKEEFETQQCALLYALVERGKLFSTSRQNDQAIVDFQEAVNIYHTTSWEGFLFTRRKQEIGTTAYSALSMQLEHTGQLEEAFVYAYGAVELYRELASLAPRHQPTLATALQRLADICWQMNGEVENKCAVDFCWEAVQLYQDVAVTDIHASKPLVTALNQLAQYLVDDTAQTAAISEQISLAREQAEMIPRTEGNLFEPVLFLKTNTAVAVTTGNKSRSHIDQTKLQPEHEDQHEGAPLLKAQEALPSAGSPRNVSLSLTPLKVILQTPVQLNVQLEFRPINLFGWLLIGFLVI